MQHSAGERFIPRSKRDPPEGRGRASLRVRATVGGGLSGVGLGVLLVACFDPETSVCPSGYGCPRGTTCQDLAASRLSVCVQQERGDCGIPGRTVSCSAGRVCDVTSELCVSPEQYEACAGQRDGAPCQLAGYPEQAPFVCQGKICIPRLGCGNGQADPGEGCDDWNLDDQDGCSHDCQVEAGWACRGSPSTCTRTCGNEVIDGVEVCDGSDVGESSCESLGLGLGALYCAGCIFDTDACLDGTEIPGGTFTMGSPPDEPGRRASERQHVVTIGTRFWIQTTELTQRQFERIMGYNPSDGVRCGPDCPVDSVSWHEVALFLNRLSAANGLPACYDCTLKPPQCDPACDPAHPPACDPACTPPCHPELPLGCDPSCVWDCGANCVRNVRCSLSVGVGSPQECSGFRMPTEAEWEYATRAGDERATPVGDLDATQLGCDGPDPDLDGFAWTCTNSRSSVHPARALAANAWGLYDTLGNVAEWVHDGFASYAGDAVDPWGPLTVCPVDPDDPGFRVVRGGGWYWDARRNRSAYRRGVKPAIRSPFIGARVVRSLLH